MDKRFKDKIVKRIMELNHGQLIQLHRFLDQLTAHPENQEHEPEQDRKETEPAQ